ncbi:hypothetical protein SPRG_08359 [Saprolegnia parasitica CBS 223.65]|uniref:Uncharacterized protein n=1 Tax=Saprolegnia parasitica (strain CBS 223.65) TaxID=695850 RepID=A0A067C698_SAPPC|nr:hypothetical protein SPRG_08359 [Saprolegnia parasitica CBS 223.65]KDO26284.1 hypothetical protein SPRG_08359 [Saprolegnia parasitica CBS 223.65]|eukprot:XP_012202989.1 hypothetical protein SPRG_08359 [Saprolegnia parasitica CBS 223.65]
MAVAPPHVADDLLSAEWSDATELFFDASNALTLSQMVHVPFFNSFESMSALELMDPKMDAGMVGQNELILPVAERLAKGLIPMTFTSATSLVATLDRIEQCESAWRNGQSMEQSLLMCLYLHPVVSSALLQLESDDVMTLAVGPSRDDSLLCVFRAYLLLTIKACTIQRNAILRADIYEEEDFAPASADVPRGDVIDDALVFAALEIAEQRLDALLAKKNKKKPSSIEPLHPTLGLELAQLLSTRLQYKKHFYFALASLGTAECPDLERATHFLDIAMTHLGQLATESLEVPPACLQPETYVGFDNHIGRVLASTAPPRAAKLESFATVVGTNQTLCAHLRLGTSPETFKSMDDLKAFLSHMSSLTPNILVRSYILLFLYIDKKMYGQYNFMEWLGDSMVMAGVPSVLLSTQEGMTYSSRCIEAVYESLKLHMHNRPRQRSRLELMLQDWVILESEAVAIDDKFVTEMGIPKATYPRYFTAWALEQTLGLMQQYLYLGFELDLYASSEFGTMYCYLDYLLGTRIHNLTNAWSFVEKLKTMTRPESSPPPAPTKAPKKNAKKGGKPAAKAKAEPEAIVDPIKEKYALEIALLETHRALVRAMFQYVVGLQLDGLLPADLPVYGSPEIRYAHRFLPFQKLQYPQPLSHAEMTRNCDFSQYDVHVVYQSSDECFKMARGHIEQVLAKPSLPARLALELKALTKVCVSNGVYLAQLEKEKMALSLQALSLTEKKAKLEIAFHVHPQYPTIQLQKSLA